MAYEKVRHRKGDTPDSADKHERIGHTVEPSFAKDDGVEMQNRNPDRGDGDNP